MHNVHLHFGVFAGIFCFLLILSRRKSLSYRKQFIDLQCKLVNWFLFHRNPSVMKELLYCMESAGIFVFACFRELTVSLTTNTMQEKKLTATVRVRPTDEK